MKKRVKTTVGNKRFEALLLDAIDEALLSLGESSRAAVYFHLEEKFGIKRKDIPKRLAEFSDALEKIFGLGARHLEILFMKNLHAKVNVAFKWSTYEWPLCKWIVPEMTFQEYVRLMRQNFESAKVEQLEMGVLLDEQKEELQK
jgi:hypothetical protein